MSSKSTDTDRQRKRIDRLFLKFTAFYGHIWRSQFKHEDFISFAKNEWQVGLQRFDDQVLDSVTVRCREHCEFPPTLSQFIMFCRQAALPTTRKRKLRVVNPSSPEKSKQHLNQLKEMLKGK